MRGDKDALAGLIKAKATVISFKARRILGYEEDAEAVALAVMRIASMHIGELEDPLALDHWLNALLLEEAGQYIDNASRYGTVLGIGEYLGSIEGPEEGYLYIGHPLGEALRKAVIGVIDSLSMRQRVAVLLFYYDGMGVDEVAEAMGVTQQAVSLCLELARQKVKSELAKPPANAALPPTLPAGAVIAAALRQEADARSGTDVALPAEAHEDGPGPLAPASRGFGALSPARKALVISVAAALGLAIGAWAYNMATSGDIAKTQPSPPLTGLGTASEVRGYIAMNGDDPTSPEVNPTEAIATASTEHGEMAALHWWITPAASGEVLSDGKGSVVSGQFSQMMADGQVGEYLIIFRMQDSVGNICTLRRIFIITEEP
jgi:DNA-directed RNA polymerase specialized sigma24 family protein